MTVQTEMYCKHRTRVWLRTTYEGGPNQNWKDQIPCDSCRYHLWLKWGSESHMSENKIRFWPLLHAAWTWPNRKAKTLTPLSFYFCLVLLRSSLISFSPSVSLTLSHCHISVAVISCCFFLIFYIVARSTSFEQYGIAFIPTVLL